MSFLDKFTKYDIPTVGYLRLPEVTVPMVVLNELGLRDDASNKQVLHKLCLQGFLNYEKSGLIPKTNRHIYIEQSKMELETFNKLHFTDYMLLVYLTIRKAKDNGTFIDFGRGSVSGSLVSWLLGISGADPLKYGLFFSRFVSESRAKSKVINGELYLKSDLIPDVDLNLGEGRGKIVDWLKETYPNRVCKILTIGTMTGKILLKDVYKTIEGVSEQDAQDVSNLVERQFGVVQDIEDVYKDNKQFKDWADKHKLTYDTALKLRDLIRQVGVHASGYLVCHDEIPKTLPVQLDSDKQIVSSYVMEHVPAVKLDLLGLTTNTIIKEVLQATGEKVENINLEDDPFIYDRLQDGKLLPYGLYQINASCGYKVCNNVKPRNIYELSHVSAIARPGGLSWEKKFVEGKEVSPHPAFTKALEWTRFCPLYQEQTMQMAVAIGFTNDEAEILRRIIGKKKLEEVKEWQGRIQAKIKENNLPEELGEILWKVASESASYSFNFAHSITTSLLTALTVYLKYKYPIQWYVACLKSIKKLEEIAEIRKELYVFGIELLQPDLLKSELDFTIQGNSIRFGLSAIKKAGDESYPKLIQFRKQHANKFELFLAAEQAGINSGLLSSLIMAGALDTQLKTNRSLLILEAQLFNLLTPREKPMMLKRGAKFDFDVIKTIQALEKQLNDKGKPVISASRMTTIRTKFKPFQDMYNNNIKHEKLSRYTYEKVHLGYSYSHTLKEIFLPACPTLINIATIKELDEKRYCEFVGEVVKVYQAKSKKGQKYLKYIINDDSAEINVMVFGEERMIQVKAINGDYPRENDVVFVQGQTGKDIVFADNINKQDNAVFLRKSELKKLEAKV